MVDLFSGVGGLSLGAARAGAAVLAAVDNDTRVAQTYTQNFPGYVHLQEDISELTGARLLSLAGIDGEGVEGVLGGPPCQGFSCIGHRNPDDERNDLFWHYFRIVAELRPSFYIAENVVGILDKRYDELRDRALSQLCGYEHLSPRVVRSSDFGVPTSRERVFFVGYRPECFTKLGDAVFRPAPGVPQVTVGEALAGLPEDISPDWQTAEQGWRQLTRRPQGWFWDKVLGSVPPGVGDPEALRRLRTCNQVSACMGTRHTEAVSARFRALEEGARDRPSRAVRLDRRSFSPTIRSGTGPDHGSFQALRPIHPTRPRVITPREAARLQGFPDWFVFDPTKWHSFRQIGNSVSPILAEAIVRALLRSATQRGKSDDNEDSRQH